MSTDAVVMVVEAVLLAVTIVFVVALLRSHAEILRRLGAIEGGSGAGVPGGNATARPGATGPAGDIVGETLAGDVVKVALGAGSPSTLLAFLSSGCAACGPLWAGLRSGYQAPPGARLVVVTNGPERESMTRLQALAPANREVVMSSSAWASFSIPATPHFVLVDGTAGEILGRGSATSWEQIEALLLDSEADRELHHSRGTSERAARAEQALEAAGITAGHPSLYPSREEAAEADRGAAREVDDE